MSIVKYGTHVSERIGMKSTREDIAKTIRHAFSIVENIDGLPADFKVAAFEVLLRHQLESGRTITQPELRRAPSEKKPARATLTQRISEFVAEGFFATPKSGSEVREELRNRGYHYSVEAVLMSLLNLVRKRELRRIVETREGKSQYSYVNP